MDYTDFFTKFDEQQRLVKFSKNKIADVALILLFYKFISSQSEILGENSKLKLGYIIDNKNLFSTTISTCSYGEYTSFIKKAFCEIAKDNSILSEIFNYAKNLFDEIDIENFVSSIINLINELEVEDYYDFWKAFIDKLCISHFLQSFATPPCISELVGKIVNIYAKDKSSVKICDTASGTGLLIAEACRSISNNGSISVSCETSDFSKYNCILTKMTMIIAGISTETINEDIFSKRMNFISDSLSNMDIVVSDVPMTLKWGSYDIHADDPRFKYFGLPSHMFADYLFLMHNLFRTNQNGATILIMNYNRIAHPDSAEIFILEKLINGNVIDAIIKLPNNLLYNTSVYPCIVILKRKKNNNNILLVDASNNEEIEEHINMDRVVNAITNKKNIKDCLEAVKYATVVENKIRGRHIKFCENVIVNVDKIIDVLINKKSIKGFSKTVSPTLLEKNSYSLSIPRYVDPIIDIMKSEDLVNLLDYVDVYYPDTSKACTATTFRSKNMKYPIDYENMEMDEGSDVEIHEGDIVFELINKHRAFYINKEPINRVVLPSSPYVCLLRLKSGILSISPKYICMYLNSQTIKKIMNVYADSIFAQRLRRQDIEKLKIIRPKLEASYYSTLFDYQISPHNQNQEPIDIINKQAKDTNIESIFIIEQIQKLWGNRQNELQEIFNSDLAEVQNCIRVKAYKSALIMCGAILEAFLVDWLNEKDPKGDWLSEHENDKTGKYNLCNYIKCIKELHKPSWIWKDPAEKAHIIREKRNLVHATLCLNSDQTIDDNLCFEVLKYLKYVISTRWK